MSEEFDPYYKWLAIPPAEQPPNFYRLLSLPLYETDQEVIGAAAAQRLHWVRKFQQGSSAIAAEKLSKEIADAWMCLRNPDHKKEYDEQLRRHVATEQIVPPHVPLTQFAAMPTHPPPQLMPHSDENGIPDFGDVAVSSAAVLKKPHSAASSGDLFPRMDAVGRLRRHKSSGASLLLQLAAGPIGLVLGYIILCQFGPQYDFLNLWNKSEEKPAAVVVRNWPFRPIKPAPAGGAQPIPPPAQPKQQLQVPNPPAQNADARAKIPDPKGQARASKTVGEIYEAQFDKAVTPAEKTTLALKLLAVGRDTEDDTAIRFVLLQSASEVAATAQDWKTSFEAVKQIGKDYVSNPLEMRVEVLLNNEQRAIRPEEIELFLVAADSVIDQAVTSKHFDLAQQLADLASKKVSSQEIAGEYADVAKQFNTLDQNPIDADASTGVGQFFCFTKENWKTGLTFLAAGSDDCLKELAIKEQNPPASADKQRELADAWCDGAVDHDGRVLIAMKHRAIYWYTSSLPQLTGFNKERAEARIRELMAESEKSPSENKPADGHTEEPSVKNQSAAQFPSAESKKAHDEAFRLVMQAIDLLTAENEAAACRNLEVAHLKDLNSTYAACMLGLLHALNDRKFPIARGYFAECERRNPDDISAVNNLAVVSVLMNDHSSAIKNFQLAFSMQPGCAEVIHNLRRVLDQLEQRNITTTTANISIYKTLYVQAAHRDPSALDKTGWLYMLPTLMTARESDEHSAFLEKIGQLPQGPHTSSSSQSIEDRACAVCGGTGYVTCPECHGLGRIRVHKQQFTGKSPLTGAATSQDVSVPETCPTCGGNRSVNCPAHCVNGVDRKLQ